MLKSFALIATKANKSHYFREYHKSLVSRCTRSCISLPLQPQKDLLEPRQIRRSCTRPCNRLALGILEFNEITNSLPSRTSGQ
jgi:hypothetical protein